MKTLKFGIEMEMTGITREEAAKAVARGGRRTGHRNGTLRPRFHRI